MGNNTDNNPIMGRNSDIISEKFRNYKPKIYESTDFFKIPFDLDNLNLIDGNIWCPSETDKEFMSQSIFDQTLNDYLTRKEKLLFTNTKVNYDSCDCGGGYSCGHGDFPYEIEVDDKLNKVTHTITIDGDDCLIFAYNKSEIQICGLKNFTYGDFIRFCKLCDITLESKYII